MCCQCPLLADSGQSSFGLLRYLESVVDLDPKVADGALQLRMAQLQLDGPEVLGSSVYQRRLGPPHRVGPVSRTIQADLAYPAVHDARVLAGREVR